MGKPFIAITGPRHSGTTFMARLVREVGYDLGYDLVDGPDVAWGLEDRTIDSLGRRLEKTHWQAGGKLAEAIRSYWPPPAAKSIFFLGALRAWVNAGGKRPTAVFLMIRDFGSILTSRHKEGWGPHLSLKHPPETEADVLFEYRLILRQVGVAPIYPCRFPEAVYDHRYAYSVMEPILTCTRDEFFLLHQRAAHPEWVHAD